MKLQLLPEKQHKVDFCNKNTFLDSDFDDQFASKGENPSGPTHFASSLRWGLHLLRGSLQSTPGLSHWLIIFMSSQCLTEESWTIVFINGVHFNQPVLVIIHPLLIKMYHSRILENSFYPLALILDPLFESSIILFSSQCFPHKILENSFHPWKLIFGPVKQLHSYSTFI